MRLKFLIIAICLFFSLQVTSQSSQTYNKVKYYCGDSLSTLHTLRSFVRLDSTIYMTVGISDDIAQGFIIVKTDMDGNLLKMRKFHDSTLSLMVGRANTMLLDKDSNLLVCSYMFDWKNPDKWEEGFIVKVNRDLDTIWTRRFVLPPLQINCDSTDTTTTVFFNIKQSIDNNYIVTGLYAKNCIFRGEPAGLIMKIDTSGNLLWTKTYDNLRTIWDLVSTPDSCYVFPDFKDGYHLNKIDKDGNPIWRVKVHNQVHLHSGQIAVNSNNEIVTFAPIWYKNLSGSAHFSNPIFKVHLLKYDLQGNQLLSKIYDFDDFQCAVINQNFELEILPNDDIIIAGTAFYPGHDFDSSSYKGVLFKANAQGDSLWTRFYSIRERLDVTETNDLILMEDGGFLVGGDHRSFSGKYNWGVWLVRTDSLGMAPGYHLVGKESITCELSSKIRTYPNPSSNYIVFDLREMKTPDTYNLVIYNTAGKEVKTMDLSDVVSEINIKDLQSGIYLYRIESQKTGRIFTGKFLKTK